ncbi:MAG: MFS transporter [Planctomycetales bacterium]|nr:MFS transporter [Planctomycetales bacterium]
MSIVDPIEPAVPVAETVPTPLPPESRTEPRSPLFGDLSFYGMTATQFLGAFNDNLFKQLMLLLAIPVGAAAATKADEQGLATMVFSLPFILFSGYAGYLSDRFSKRTVIVLAKVAEIGIMLLGVAAFLSYDVAGYRGLLVVLFLMGTHSAFFGPGKYGILPELFHKADLPLANGVILLTTFLAIIFGTASAGILGSLAGDAAAGRDPQRLWVGSAICIGIAVLGTVASLLVRKTPAANQKLQFSLSSLAIPRETRVLLAADRQLFWALLASCVFWLISGLTLQAVNSLGQAQLQLGDLRTSILTATIGLGIAFGAVAAGLLCRGKPDFRIVTAGAWGIVICMGVLSISLPSAEGPAVHLLGFWGSIPLLIIAGISAGMFAIPVQVFIQTRPPENQKGQMIATMNLTNFIAIFLSGAIYKLFDLIVDSLNWPRSPIFAFTALLLLPVAIFYRPRE